MRILFKIASSVELELLLFTSSTLGALRICLIFSSSEISLFLLSLREPGAGILSNSGGSSNGSFFFTKKSTVVLFFD